MTLRQDAIEAMTAHYVADLEAEWHEGADWTNEEIMMHALDALLDYLTEHAYEWYEHAESERRPAHNRHVMPAELLAVLREDG